MNWPSYRSRSGMIGAMIQGWGRAVSMLLMGAVVTVSAGCGNSAEGGETPAAVGTAKTPAVADAAKTYADDLDALAWAGCPSDCDKDLNEIVANARTLRTAMNDDPAGPSFWSPAYRLVDQIEEGRAKVQGDATWNRALILTPAHQLSDWLMAHPSK